MENPIVKILRIYGHSYESRGKRIAAISGLSMKSGEIIHVKNSLQLTREHNELINRFLNESKTNLKNLLSYLLI